MQTFPFFLSPSLFSNSHIEKIKNHWSGQDDLTTFHTPALAALEKRCCKHFTGGIYFLAKALDPKGGLADWSPSDRTKFSPRGQLCCPLPLGFIQSYFIPLLKKFGRGEEDVAKLRAQVGQWVHRSGSLAVPSNCPSPIEYWQEVALDIPLLSMIALAIFSIVPSEASVERSFSNQSLIHSDLRASLHDESVTNTPVPVNFKGLLHRGTIGKHEGPHEFAQGV